MPKLPPAARAQAGSKTSFHFLPARTPPVVARYRHNKRRSLAMFEANERITIDLSYADFENMVLWALEKDTGAVPIVPEIIRLLKISMRKEAERAKRTANIRTTKKAKK
jgi:hypothetical protein